MVKNITEKRNGYFVVIEGIDSSGKKTQAKRIIKKLKEGGKQTKYIDFPTYGDSQFGKIVGEFLRGKFGNREDLPKEVINLLYALDRYQFKQELDDFLSRGGVIVANRYTQSNLGFQTANLEGKSWKNMVNWIKSVESRLPQPDKVIVLDIDPRLAQELMDQKKLREYLNGEKRDINEKKIKLQEKVAENYLKLAEELGWDVIKSTRNEQLRPIEEINSEIWDKIKDDLDL